MSATYTSAGPAVLGPKVPFVSPEWLPGLQYDWTTHENYWRMREDIPNSIAFQFATIVLYLAIVGGLMAYVKSQGAKYVAPKGLKSIAFWHNVGLSLVSLAVAVLQIRGAYLSGRFDSWEAAACRVTRNDGLYGLANFVYTVCKIWEWADTVFIVLSGKTPIFLHLSHHATTFTMAALVQVLPVGAFAFINSLVHFVMYAHYARPQRWLRPYITTFQIGQFLCVISIHTYGYLSGCFPMDEVWLEFLFCETVVVGFLIFFLNFAVQQYLVPQKKKSKAP